MILLSLPMNAFAHWGHLGEVAGHGHWVALGAGVAAAAIAAWLGKEKLKANVEGEEAPEDGEGETEAAGV
jgi:hypothetical protein